jgi:oligopeptide transport system substrate-binding protein
VHLSFERERRAAFVVAACVVLAILPGCRHTAQPAPTSGPLPGQVQPVTGGVLSFDLTTPVGIDPRDVHDVSGAQVDDAIFDSLVRVDPLDSGNLLPSAAETWSVNATGTVWTFKLDPGDRFHEGTPVTAQDFVYAWNRIVSPNGLDRNALVVSPSLAADDLSPVIGWGAVRRGVAVAMSGLKAVDDRTLEVTLSHPFADFPYVVARPAFAPVLKKFVEGGIDYKGQKIPFAEMPVGNGPFKISAPWKRGDDIRIVRNEDYYGVKAHLDAVEFRMESVESTTFETFMAGKLDVMRIPAGRLAAVIATGGVSTDGYTAQPHHQVLQGSEDETLMLVFNARDKATSNANLRKAVSLAIDRQALCAGAFADTFEPADDVVPDAIVGHQAGAWTDARFDMKAAKAAMRASGLARGKKRATLALTYVGGGDGAVVARYVARALRPLGIQMTLVPLDQATYAKRIESGAFQVALVGWRPEAPTMDGVLSALFASTSKQNWGGYSSVTVDRGIAASRATTDTAARLSRYLELDSRISQADPVSPLVVYRHRVAASRRVNDFVFGPHGVAELVSTWVTDGSSR